MLVNYDDLPNIRSNSNCIIGLFKGTFDLFHYSHLNILNTIKSKVDVLVVEVKSDEDVKKKKGISRPIIPQIQRATIVDNIKTVDYTIIADKKKNTNVIQSLIKENDYSSNEIEKIQRDGYIIEMLKPNYVFSTDEKPFPKVIKDICNKFNLEYKIVPMHNGMHTTEIIQKCKKSY